MAALDEKLSILVLSGGGANGAYGAGVLVGWTETGERPPFSIVTGVSTGAFAAPFAFLGPGFDGVLKALYTEGRTAGLLSWRPLAFLFQPSLFSSKTLQRLVDEYVTQELLEKIAAQCATGRLLLIGTTNLDSEETVIWNMCALAKQGGPQALARFRQVLVASGSIPGVFPPVMIPRGSADGRAITEMHVDGSLNTPFLAAPDALIRSGKRGPYPDGSKVYVLINGRLGRENWQTDGTFRSILERAAESAGKASLRLHLDKSAATAAHDGLRMFVAAIPEGARSSSLDLSPKAMSQLFELGRSRAASRAAWQELHAK